MSVLGMKNLLLKAIANTDDEAFLQVLLMVIQEQKQELLDWNSLSKQAAEDIHKGLAQLDQGKGKSHQAMTEKYRAWLQK